MKRSVCILLALCLILPCIALSEGWVCPSCGRQGDDADRFCGGCGEKRPTITAETVGRDYIEISWSGFGDAGEYWLYIGNAAADDWNFLGSTAGCYYVITGLQPGTVYDVRVRAGNGVRAVLEGTATKAAPMPEPTAVSAPAPTATPTPVQTAYPANLADSLMVRELEDGTLEITGYTGSYNDIVIPGVIDGKVVSSIRDYAFTESEYAYGREVLGRDNTDVSAPHHLTSVTIPDSVTSIGIYTFYRCSSLTSITIPDSVTSIGIYAFYRCSSLTSITIPDSVTSIGELAFGWCNSLKSITIPSSVTSIGEQAFYCCNRLTTITVTRGSYAEQWCKNHGYTDKITYK